MQSRVKRESTRKRKKTSKFQEEKDRCALKSKTKREIVQQEIEKEDKLFDYKTAFAIKLENNELNMSANENGNLKFEPDVPAGVCM